MVGHADGVARDGVGNAKRSLARGGYAHFCQIGRQRSIHGGELRTGQHARVVQGAARFVLPGQSDVGAADVGKEALRVHGKKMKTKGHTPPLPCGRRRPADR